MLLRASKEMPLVKAASPATAMMFSVPPGQVAGHRHAQSGRKRRAGVARAVAVVFALGAQAEAVEAVGLADGAEALPPPGQNLVDVDLVADVPDEPVLGGVEDVVEGQGKFDDAEIGAQVAAGPG